MSLQKSLFGPQVSLADLAEHPPDRLMNEVVFVMKKDLRDEESIIKITLPYECQSRHDRDPSFPEIFRSCKAVKHRPVPVEQIIPQDIRRRKVDEVPIIDMVRLLQIEIG